MHITSGPLFVAMWPLFSSQPYARYCAALICVLNALRYAGTHHPPWLPELAGTGARDATDYWGGCSSQLSAAASSRRLAAIGTGVIEGPNTVRAVSRQNDRCASFE